MLNNIHVVRGRLQIGSHSLSAEVPDECPLCHRYSQIPIIVASAAPSRATEAIFQCGYSECGSYFIGYYNDNSPVSSPLSLVKVSPALPAMKEISEVISEISPMFVSIYREAEQALCLGLSQICGPGYRKAFEFLIKDYTKTLHPTKGEKIDKALPGDVVKNYVDNVKVKETAERCLWLGNDESHYLRKWSEHDIQDFINLIHITIHWIEMEQISRSYTENMKK